MHNTLTKEQFIRDSGIESEKAEKLYDQLNRRFDGDWNKTIKYLKDMIEYLNT